MADRPGRQKPMARPPGERLRYGFWRGTARDRRAMPPQRVGAMPPDTDPAPVDPQAPDVGDPGDILFDNAHDAIALLDHHDRVLRVNAAFTALFGYEADEATGRSLDRLIVPEAGLEDAVRLNAELASGRTCRIEALRRRRDGSTVHVSVIGVPVPGGDRPSASYAIYRDVSDRKRADELETALHRSDLIARARANVIERSLQSVDSDPSLESLSGQVLRTIVTELDASSGAFWLCDEDDEMLARIYLAFEDGRIVRGEDIAHPGREPRPIPEEIASHWRRRRFDPVVYQRDDYPESDTLAFCRDFYQARNIRTVMTLPLVFGDRLFATCAVRWTRRHDFGPDDLRLASSLAMQAALALQLARFAQRAGTAALAEERERAAQARAAELGMLNETLRAEVAERRRAEQMVRGQAAIILRSLDSIRDQFSVDAFVEEVLKTIVEQLGGMGASLWIPEGDDGTGRVVLDFDLHGFRRGDAIDHPARAPGRLPYMVAGRSRGDDPEPIVLDAHFIDHDPSYAAFRPWARRLGIRTVLVLPLIYGGQSLGVLGIRFGHDHAFSPDELRLTRALALHAMLSLQLARLGRQASESAVLREREETALRRATEISNANRILQDALQILTSEPELNTFLAFVLRSIVECFGAHSSSLQVQNAEGTRIWFLLSWQDGRLYTSDEYRDSPLGRAYDESAGFDLRREVFEQPEAHFVTDRETATTVTPSIREALRTLGVQSLANIPLLIGSRVTGRLIIRFDRPMRVGPDELQLMQSIANQMGIAMHMTRLAVEGRKSAVLGERTRMARDIHDTLAQGFTGVIVQLEAAKDAITLRRADDADAHIERASTLARQSLAEARRSVHALRPLALEHGSLSAALATMLETMTAGTAIRAGMLTDGDPYAIPLDWEDDLLRIGQEALTNALKHGRPTHVEARLRFSPADIVLEVVDNGVGFDPAEVSSGFGLVGMRERCTRMGGRFELDTAAGHGVCIRVTLALDL